MLFFVCVVTFAPPAYAAPPTQEDVFRSISDKVSDDGGDMTRLIPFAVAAAGLVILVAVIGQRKKRQGLPRGMNHHGKLLKEITKSLPLRPAELRQLKLLAEDADDDRPLVSPLALLLCPSVLASQISKHQGRCDRKVLTHLARKAGLTVKRG